MAWDFYFYGIDLEQFEYICSRLLRKHGFTPEQCSKYADILNFEESLTVWEELSEIFEEKTNLSWSDHLEELGVNELFWHRSKNNCLGLNNLVQWYLSNASEDPSAHLIFSNNCSFMAPTTLSFALIRWVLNVIAFLERQRNPDFWVQNTDFEFQDALLPQIEAFFESENPEAEEYRYLYDAFFFSFKAVLKAREEFYLYFWRHSF